MSCACVNKRFTTARSGGFIFDVTKEKLTDSEEFSQLAQEDYTSQFHAYLYCAVASDEYLFNRYLEQWHTERGTKSNPIEAISCRGYQKIIAMGKNAVPLIIKQMIKEGTKADIWYPALEAITHEDPVLESSIGNNRAMAADWIKWAKGRYAI